MEKTLRNLLIACGVVMVLITPSSVNKYSDNHSEIKKQNFEKYYKEYREYQEHQEQDFKNQPVYDGGFACVKDK